MANTVYAETNTRPHMGGADQDIDQHLEKYEAILETGFGYNSLMLGYSAQRNVDGQTNTYRYDQMNVSQVKGRVSGEQPEGQAVTSDKALIVVDVMMYIRNTFDYNDEWTSPDRTKEIGDNNATEFALAYDEAHIIRLIKSRAYTAPAHLKPALGDGISINVSIAANAATEEVLQSNASALHTGISKVVTHMVKQRVPRGNLVALIKPELYETLTHHPKLLNKDYTTDNGDFAERRVVKVQGLPVIECIAFPTEVGNTVLGKASNAANFTVSAEDLKAGIVIFDKARTLVTVTAKAFTTKFWDNSDAFANVLDSYSMWTVDVRRPDTAATILVTEV